jgi:CRP/FNR family cyclic AMP-dependent transcriptional regulator
MGSPADSENVLIERLQSEGFVCTLPSRATLFMQGETARGVHIISKGHVKLSIGSCEGRVLILRITEPGEILGLHNCLTGAPYEMTAQTLQSCRVSFVKLEDLMRVLHHDCETCLSAAEQLGRTCHMAYSQIGSVQLSHSVSEKLARFLLSLSAAPSPPAKGCNGGMQVEMDLTHDEIAQAIGASRETVTRTLAGFRRKHVAKLTRSMLLVQSHAELEKIAGIGSDSAGPTLAVPQPRKRGPVAVAASRPLSTRGPTSQGSGARAS